MCKTVRNVTNINVPLFMSLIILDKYIFKDLHGYI